MVHIVNISLDLSFQKRAIGGGLKLVKNTLILQVKIINYDINILYIKLDLF
jgi:hypothetical protein